MRLIRIRAQNFAMHTALDLNLSGVGALAIGGENGAGKSRLLDLVLYSLYGRPVRGRPDQLIAYGQHRMTVQTTWEHEGREIVVRRSRDDGDGKAAAQSALDLQVDGERLTKHTIAETEAAILEFCPPLNVVSAGPVMAQGDSDALMRADPRERKDLLAKLFGLEEYELYHEEAKGLLSRAQGKETFLLSQVDRLEHKVAAGEALAGQQEIAERALFVARDEAATALEAVSSLREEAVRMKAREDRIGVLNTELKTAQHRLDVAQERLDSIEEQVRMETAGTWQMGHRDPIPQSVIDEAEANDARHRTVVAALNDARVHAESLALTIEEAARQDLCDRCPYGADARKAPAELAEWNVKVKALEAEAKMLGDAPAYFDKVRREASAIAVEIARYEADQKQLELIQGFKAMRDQTRAEVESLQAEVRDKAGERLRLQQEMSERDNLTAQLQAATEALTDANRKRDEAEGTLAAARAQADEWRRNRTELDEARQSLKELGAKLGTIETVTRMFHRDGLPLMILNRGLPLIEARANEILGRLPGGIRLTLVTSRETKQGAAREALDVMVEQDGHEVLYEVLSGAERFRVDFALRLGMTDVLAARSGRTWKTLWLDEPFSAQSPTALETVLECLTAVADEFGLMVVVTHQPDVAERFPARLIVAKEESVATATLQS